MASPDYLASHDGIESPDDLSAHSFVAISQFSSDITVHRNGENVAVSPQKSQVEVNSVAAAKSAVVAGVGLRQLPLSDIEDELAAGELVRVLPEWTLPLGGIYAVWPDAGPQKALTRRLIDSFVAHKDWLLR